MDERKILVVDDETHIIETIRFRLEQQGYGVATVGDGVEALNTVRKTEPDLIILDVMIPKENAYRVSQKIKEDEKAGTFSKRIPIILLTARNLERDPERERFLGGHAGTMA